jgi:phosphoribosyl 1,2-cyclic phosphodiesterase
MLKVASLGSGSCGNALLIWTERAALLIDCGLALRTVERQLRYLSLAPERLTAVLLTHEHGDHRLSAAALARRYNVPLLCNAETGAALAEQQPRLRCERLPEGETAAIAEFEVRSFAVPHDAAAPVGYEVAAEGLRIGLAIDLGSWNEQVLAGLRAADLLIVEANHDRELLAAAPYPWLVQQRIHGPLGHLDNVQSGELLAQIAQDGRRRDVWLAHLSEQANSARRAMDEVRRVLALQNCEQHCRLNVLPRRSQCAPGRLPIWSGEAMLQQQSLFG